MFPADASRQTTALEITKAREETLACHLIPRNTSIFLGSFSTKGGSFSWSLCHRRKHLLGRHLRNVGAAIWIFFFFCWRKKKTKLNFTYSYSITCVAIGKCPQRSPFCSEVSVQVLPACICQVSIHFLSSTETLLSLCRQLRLFIQ